MRDERRETGETLARARTPLTKSEKKRDWSQCIVIGVHPNEYLVSYMKSSTFLKGPNSHSQANKVR